MTHKSPPATHRIALSLQMICDEMDDLFWDYSSRLLHDTPHLTGCRLYYPGCPLKEDLVYILPEAQADHFPADSYCYITPADLHGNAPHLSSLHHSVEEILDFCLNIFQRYREFESQLNEVITGDGSLTELCLVGSEFFRNPLYIHDSMFSVIALPRRIQGMIDFDINQDTGEIHIPLWLINDFKYDEDYQATLKQHRASIWGHDQFPHPIRSLYVNLWEGDYYYGRLLINEIESSIKPGQFYLAECFAEYCKMILRRDNQRASRGYIDHEETLRSLISGRDAHESDVAAMMDTLGWQPDHHFLVLKLINQDKSISVRSDSALRSQLAGMFQGSVQFFHEQSLCVLFNLSLTKYDPSEIFNNLAPLIRDNYLFGGLSTPVRMVPDLSYAAIQADLALQYMKNHHTTRWLMTFTDCSLDYILASEPTGLPRRLLIPPNLFHLRQYDKENSTQYYETLRTFILCERSIPNTSKALFIHRTTLLYRLDKLQNILRMNLDNDEIRLLLLISFRFMDRLSPADIRDYIGM